jgi:hypothetical protein
MKARLYLGALVMICALTALLAMIVVSQAADPTNYELTTVTTSICTAENWLAWSRIYTSFLGIDGVDPVGRKIEDYPAKRTFVGRNWYPVSGYKHTLCGQLHHFNFYDGWGAEADWNLFIIPNSESAYLLDYVLPFADPDDVHDCRGANDCMEAEITPDEHYYENPYFTKSTDTSALEGQTVCVYGPWVAEEAHGWRPEIHPSELIWWRSGDSAYLMLLQDDSNRFDRTSDYADVPSPPPSSWRPWSKWPRTGKFKLAFSLRTALDAANWTVYEETVRDVYSDTGDADDGTEHQLVYNGKALLTIREVGYPDGNVQVYFEDVCRTPENDRLIGYVTLTSKVGFGDRGDEGWHLLRVQQRSQPGGDDVGPAPSIPRLVPRKSWVLPKVVRTSLRRVQIGGQSQLVADVEPQMVGGPDASRADLAIAKVELVSGNRRQALVFQAGLVKNVPVLPGSQVLEFTLNSGSVVRLTSSQLSVAPLIAAESLRFSAAGPSAWLAVVTAVGGRPVSSTPPAQLLTIPQWRLQAAPSYAVRREGQISIEDDSPMAEELTEVVRSGNSARMKELFGSTTPFKVDWSFQAINLITGSQVPVKLGQNVRATEVRVELLPGPVSNGEIRVTFPTQPPNAIYELTATARMTDSLGTAGELRHRVWSHALAGGSVAALAESLLRTVAALASIPADELVAASRRENLEEPRTRRARAIRMFALHAAGDGRVTLGELRSLIRGAKLFGSP